MKVYPIGYTNSSSMTHIKILMEQENVLLIDTRYSPKSRMAEWRSESLQAQFGGRYRQAGRYLGNLNYQGGPIRIVNPIVGIKGLKMYLKEGYDLILLCACSNYEQCHRKTIVDLLTASLPEVEVIQPDTLVTPDTLPCLSIRQPWAFLISQGLKDIENREWTTCYRGPLLLHAGSKADEDWFYPARHPKAGQLRMYEAERLEVDDVMPKHISEYPLGAIVGVCDLVDVGTYRGNKWFCGTYGFALANVQAFDEPIPWKGALRLFPVPVCHCCNMPVREDEYVMAEQYRLCYRCCK